MKIALIGASGFVGSALHKEAAPRGHSVTAIVRNPGKIAEAKPAGRDPAALAHGERAETLRAARGRAGRPGAGARRRRDRTARAGRA